MGRAERRQNTEKKVNQRKRILNDIGMPEGDLYVNSVQKRTAKIKSSLGYLRNGHVKHYLGIGPNIKTKNSARIRNEGPGWARKRSYGAKFNYKPHDARQIIEKE